MITIIAEKPSVAQAIARIVHSDTRKDGYYEGSRYYVTWAFGHMVEIYAEGADSWDADLPLIPDSFSLRVARTHTPKGDRADPGYAKQLGVIRSLAARSEAVINAGDAGREGELIQRYIYAYIGLRKPVRRLWISSLTDSAIRKGLEELRPSRDYDALYEAGRARSEADWLVGINATRALTRASGGKRVLSLGRVQTPTLGIVCRRFLENRDFVPSPFWTLKAEARLGKAVFTARSPRFGDRREALCAIEPALSAPGMVVETVERTTKEVQPPLLHDLTSLQKACNQRYGMTADETLSAAQSLYEKKLITYPRTGSRYITEDVFASLPALLGRLSDGVWSVPGQLNRRSVNDGRVSDHHAIIPTGEKPSAALGEGQERVYGEVLLRFRESLSPLCEELETTVSFRAAGVTFTAKGREVLTRGWRAVRGEDVPREDEEGNEVVELLPPFHKGDCCQLDNIAMMEGQTSPRPLLTDATLLEAMEHAGREVEDKTLRSALKECGLGTPATRAGEIETLLRRGYMERKGKSLVPTPLGLSVYEIVKDKAVADVALTAKWESALSAIAEGKGDAGAFDRGIRELTRTVVSQLLSAGDAASSLLRGEALSGASCPLCGKAVLLTTKVVRCSDEDCGWKIWRSCYGKALSEREIRSLLGQGETRELTGLVGKNGKPFAAKLSLDGEGKVALRFVDHARDEDGNALLCPSCGKPVRVFSNRVLCPDEKCGWKMWRLIAGKPVTDRMLPVLLKGGTTELLRGFVSKSGKRFDASLRLGPAQELEFVFQKTLKQKKSW